MKWFGGREQKALEARCEKLVGDFNECQKRLDRYTLDILEKDTQLYKLRGVIREQNDVDLFWAARRVMREADAPAAQRVDGLTLMAQAMTNSRERAQKVGTFGGFGNFFGGLF